MPTETLRSAAVLTEALNENTAALKAVKARFRFILVFVVIVALVLTFVIKSRYDNRVNACGDQNELKTGLLRIADQIEAGVPRPISPENAQLIASMREDFALSNCGDIPWI